MKKFSPKQEKTETKMKTWAEESADTADEEKLTERDTVTTKKKQKKSKKKKSRSSRKERTDQIVRIEELEALISKYGEDVYAQAEAAPDWRSAPSAG